VYGIAETPFEKETTSEKEAIVVEKFVISALSESY